MSLTLGERFHRIYEETGRKIAAFNIVLVYQSGPRSSPRELPLMTMEDNLRFSKHKEIKGKAAYERYVNYDAIEVALTDAIPSDYDGVMGVPITFLDKYNPDQFEIVGN